MTQPTQTQIQAGHLAQAMQGAIVAVNNPIPPEERDPEALAAALAHVTAMFLASMPDAKTRKNFRKGIEKLTSRQLATFLSQEGSR